MGMRHFRDHGKRRTLMSCLAELNCDDEHSYFKPVDQFIVEMDPQSGCTWIDPSRRRRWLMPTASLHSSHAASRQNSWLHTSSAIDHRGNLPAPFGPIIARPSPLSTLKLRSSITTRFPKATVRAVTESSGPVVNVKRGSLLNEHQPRSFAWSVLDVPAFPSRPGKDRQASPRQRKPGTFLAAAQIQAVAQEN